MSPHLILFGARFGQQSIKHAFKKSFKNQFKFKKHDQNCLIIHGDGILKEDYGYRLFRRIIRSKLCIFLYNLLPPRIGYLIAKKISKADKPKEYYKDNELINKKLLSYAKEKWKEVSSQKTTEIKK